MVDSLVWTDEEARYIKAVFRWKDADDDAAARRTERRRHEQQKPAGEFRVLVVGAKGTGKTSILTRFGQDTFPSEAHYDRGCRRPVELDDGQQYMVDALELPAKHLPSDPMLGQALDITEAAVLVYDVQSAQSLRIATAVAEFIRDNVGTREYALMLVGNKTDTNANTNPNDINTKTDDSGEVGRRVSRAEGAKAAAGLKFWGAESGCAFVEVSAKTGEGVDGIFPRLGKEILRVKRANRLRREQAERIAKQQQQLLLAQKAGAPGKKRLGLWKTLSIPFFKRQSAY
ncbi:P-loop containing nucleoside triphosphate hydrolase protein [Cercophora scortea]|uniref:P-loop containing nucleoside triphosphate hydrolase protein n=1 Tax=Cercophora scortea TaxID=314031 RepID=A0AAE0IMK0_9PEZI|nr:P-loop containing nucleoside triphosphate hydrolase protein [Cercophora scortea]